MTPRRPLPLLAALLLPALAACAPPGEDAPAPFPGLFGPREPAAAEPEPLPPNVLAALPPGVPPSVVLEDGQGCYLYSIERTDPPSGYPLRDAAGNQVCEGGAAPPVAPIETVAGLAADVAAGVPALEEPAAADGEGPIDITPVLTAPLPAAAPPSAPAPGAVPVAGADPVAPAVPPAIVPGDITPPAPLAPLN
jgi:hypothetical protein